MRLATIVPTAHLVYIRNDSYFMALAHVLRKDSTYREFYKRAIQEGAYVIMDNGAAEGEQPPTGELIDLLLDIRPTEFILPDTLYDKDETIQKSEEMLRKLQEVPKLHDLRLMAVPQGETLKEWIECAKHMLWWSSSVVWPMNVMSLGISKFMTPKMGRQARLAGLSAIWEDVTKRGVKIHLLGCWDDPYEIRDINEIFQVRGADSSIAAAYTECGEELKPHAPRPKPNAVFNPSVTLDAALLDRNIAMWRGMCYGTV